MDFLNTFFPIRIIVLLGFYTGRIGWFADKHVEAFEHFLFKIAIPCILFNTTLKTPLKEILYLPYVLCYLTAFLIIIIINILFFWQKCSTPQILIRTLLSGYVNSALYGVPILTFTLGDPKAALLNNIMQIVLIHSLFMFMLSILLNKSQKSVIKKIINTLKTPIIIMPILGMAFSYLSITLPTYITKITETLAISVNGLALFSFGLIFRNANLEFFKLIKEAKYVILVKNFIHPLISWILGKYIFHLENYWLLSIIIMSSGPTAIIVYLLSKQFEIDIDISKQVVTTTSLISFITLLITYMLIYSAFKINLIH